MCQNMMLDTKYFLQFSAHMEESEQRIFILGLGGNFANILLDSKGVQCSLSWKTEIEAAPKLLQAFNPTNISWKVLKIP